MAAFYYGGWEKYGPTSVTIRELRMHFVTLSREMDMRL